MAKSSIKKPVANKVNTIFPPQQDTISAIVSNKATKGKEKVMFLSDLLLNKKITIDELVEKAKSQKDTIKATLIEAVEYASKANAEIVNEKAFDFAIQSLKEAAPRIKWEGAKIISNTAQLFPKLLNKAVVNLLVNTEHNGSVVRWSAATALSKIISLDTPLNNELIPTVEAIIQREEDNAVKKIYLLALKRTKR